MSEHDHHCHDIPASALLAHMVEHNRSHLAELEELSQTMRGAAAEKVLSAVETIRRGNEELAEAIKHLEE